MNPHLYNLPAAKAIAKARRDLPAAKARAKARAEARRQAKAAAAAAAPATAVFPCTTLRCRTVTGKPGTACFAHSGPQTSKATAATLQTGEMVSVKTVKVMEDRSQDHRIRQRDHLEGRACGHSHCPVTKSTTLPDGTTTAAGAGGAKGGGAVPVKEQWFCSSSCAKNGQFEQEVAQAAATIINIDVFEPFQALEVYDEIIEDAKAVEADIRTIPAESAPMAIGVASVAAAGEGALEFQEYVQRLDGPMRTLDHAKEMLTLLTTLRGLRARNIAALEGTEAAAAALVVAEQQRGCGCG